MPWNRVARILNPDVPFHARSNGIAHETSDRRNKTRECSLPNIEWRQESHGNSNERNGKHPPDQSLPCFVRADSGQDRTLSQGLSPSKLKDIIHPHQKYEIQ